jgi:hypothetical protein
VKRVISYVVNEEDDFGGGGHDGPRPPASCIPQRDCSASSAAKVAAK